MLNATKQQSNKATFSVSPPLLKIAPYRAENWALSIGEICADELFFVPLHCESSPREHWLRLGIERALLCIGLPPYLHL